MCQLYWWKHMHAQQLLLAKRSEMWLFNYCSAITSSIPTGIFRNFIITCQGTKYVPGHNHVWAQTYTFVPRHICAQTWLWPHDYIMTGHKRVWAQTCLGTNLSGHKHVWEQTCLGKNVWSPAELWRKNFFQFPFSLFYYRKY